MLRHEAKAREEVVARGARRIKSLTFGGRNDDAFGENSTMRRKLPLLLVVLMLTVIAFVGLGFHTHAQDKTNTRADAKNDGPPKHAADEAPPEIKKGVRLLLSINQRSPFNPAKFGEGFIVEEVRGNWVRMKGEPFEGYPGKEKEISAWINFRLVEWYKVK